MLDIIVKMKFGSHLYGTDTPMSDTDYKGIYLPSFRDVAIGKIKKCYIFNTKTNTETKNVSSDVDFEIYSLHYFIELALQGETVALDMIHAPNASILFNSPIWEVVHKNRSKLYTKNLKAFVGYARTQAAKYGIKGSRLSKIREVIEFFNKYPVNTKISEIWDILPTGEHTGKEVDVTGQKLYVVCGKRMQSNAQIKQIMPSLIKYQEQYGQRAKLAETNTGIDWKAISHALRAAFQVKEVLTTGDLIFPLKEAEYLKLVKSGALNYKNDVGPRLEREMEELEILSQNSSLPENPDVKFWEDFLYDIYYHQAY